MFSRHALLRRLLTHEDAQSASRLRANLRAKRLDVQTLASSVDVARTDGRPLLRRGCLHTLVDIKRLVQVGHAAPQRHALWCAYALQLPPLSAARWMVRARVCRIMRGPKACVVDSVGTR